MKERPILFSDAMVRAILDGCKTQTRRVIKPEHIPTADINRRTPRFFGSCPYGQPGDRLWVRESFNWSTNELLLPGEPHQHCPERAVYAAQNVVWRADGSRTHPDYGKALWLPSIHMPRWASRILLEITNIRVERVQDISDTDAFAEGIQQVVNEGLRDDGSVRGSFRALWDSINAARGHGWEVNPWVWVIEFRVVK